MADDIPTLPWDGAEKPTPKTRLQEMLEGQQIAFLHYLDTPGPTASRGIALELTTGAKLMIFAARDRNSVFSARLMFRWLNPPLIVLPRMARAFSQGRDGDPSAEPPDDLQRRVEGAVIHGVLHSTKPTRNRGEQCAIELRGGARLAFGAEPIMRMTADGELLAADLVWSFSEPERSRIVMS